MNRNIFLAVFLAVLASMLVGCGGGGGGGSSNPVGTNIVDSSNQTEPNFVRACISPVVKRKFSFAKNNSVICQRFRDSIRAVAARIRLELLSDSNNEDINLVISSMKVKNTSGQTFSFDEEAEVQLNGNSLSALLAQKDLPAGKYNYIEFKVESASIKELNRTTGELEEYGVHIPFDKLRCTGNFELKDGYETTLTILFSHKLIINAQAQYNRALEVQYLIARAAYLAAKASYERSPNALAKAIMVAAKTAMDNAKDAMSNKYTLVPTIKLGCKLTPIVEQQITEGDITGKVTNLVDGTPLSNISISIESLRQTVLTDANGNFSFNSLPVGTYNIVAVNDDYLSASCSIDVGAGQISDVTLQMNPAVIHSTVGETGWFSEYYPLADINGTFGEVGLETPIRIDFVSMSFVKAEITFNAKLHANGSSVFYAYLATDQQVSADGQIGNWWAGNTCHKGIKLGDEFLATSDSGYTYTIDITEQLKQNPSNIYYLAAENADIVDIKLSDIQINVYYK